MKEYFMFSMLRFFTQFAVQFKENMVFLISKSNSRLGLSTRQFSCPPPDKC